MFYIEFTKSAQATAPENIDPKRTLRGLFARVPVFSLSRITLEYNGKIRPRLDREKFFSRASGGSEGIRTDEQFEKFLNQTEPSGNCQNLVGVKTS